MVQMKEQITRFSLVLLLMVASLPSLAQLDSLASAEQHLQGGNILAAKKAIDSASVHKETILNSVTWYYRGFIYKELYRKYESTNQSSNARNESLISFLKSIQLDTAKEFDIDNRKNIKFLGATFFNDAASSLNENSYEIAIANFEKYANCNLVVDSSFNISQKKIEFNLALGSVYTSILERDWKKNADFIDKIAKLYLEVLAIEPENQSGNYNLGILYYNQAVNIINEMDYDLDMVSLLDIQDNCVSLFKKSLPYMEKAYKLNPKRKETLIGLSGIYFSLNEIEKSNQIKALIKAMEE